MLENSVEEAPVWLDTEALSWRFPSSGVNPLLGVQPETGRQKFLTREILVFG